jgi:hypothetical protein
MTLSEAHRAQLERGSSISPSVIDARGYRTVTDVEELMKLGFKSYQARPGLLVPIHTTDGGNSLYRLKPDAPRVVEDKEKRQPDGSFKQRVFKYEQPAHQGLRLDCNPISRPLLPQVGTRIFFVEGEKKADSLASRGQCAISLPGVTGYKNRNQYGGVTLTADLDYIALKPGRPTFIVFDSDVASNPDVSKAESVLAQHLKRKGGDVHIIRLPSADGKKVGVDDWFASGHDLQELLELVVEDVETLARSYHFMSDYGLTGIVTTGRHMRDISEDAMQALVTANAIPYLFVRSGQLVRVVMDEEHTPSIQCVGENEMRGRLARVANFVAMRQAKDALEAYPVDPPMAIVRDILASGGWPLPAISGVIECPSIRPDGSIITAPGYDRATGLVYVPRDGMVTIDIPANPSRGDVARAKSALLEPLQDFPFSDEASLANALAAIITPIMRPAIDGRVPLCLMDAPQMGTGKSLLSGLVSTIATGRPQAVITAPRDDDEWRKRITAALMTGSAVITIDNLTGKLYSGDLASVLTAPEWSDRVLGASKMVRLPNVATWVATGNNVQLGGDMARRCYWVRLDAKLSRPWQRYGFKIANLADWCMTNRGRLISSALTLARAWYVAGCPAGDAPKVGSFEQWSQVIGGVLSHANIRSFLSNLVEMYEIADTEGPQWEAFLLGLGEAFKEPVTLAQVCDRIASDAHLQELIPDALGAAVDDKGNLKAQFKRQLSYAVRSRKGTRYGDSQVRIDSVGADRKRAVTWSIRYKNAEDAEDAEDVSCSWSFSGSTTRSTAQKPEQSEISSASSASSADELLSGSI